jgi:DNA-binding NtrC family response regulator
MPIQGVLFYRRKPRARMLIEKAAGLAEKVGELHRPVVVVVRKTALSLFAEQPVLYLDRHRKDARKGLAEQMLGESARIPYIDVDFASLGRLEQSVKALLGKAASKSKDGIYILGIGEELFGELWADCESDGRRNHAEDGSGPSCQPVDLPGEEELAQKYWGESEAYHMVRQRILRAARHTEPVLIIGATGTGKEIVARLIHDRQRRGESFVEFNCAAVPYELLESELFGCEPGAFSGAPPKTRIGLWEVANDGTLFLDEVGDLQLAHQAKLLTALEHNEIRRLGGNTMIPVTARIIAATNKNLDSMVRGGQFRLDLLYRLRKCFIRTPELNKDKSDLILIAQKLWMKITEDGPRLPQEILDELCRHSWPGNVRELSSILGALYHTYGSKGIGRANLVDIYRDNDIAQGFGQSSADLEDSGSLQVKCLNKIRGADDVIHACELALAPLRAGQRMKRKDRELLTSVQIRVRELLEHRLDFGSHGTYEAVLRVAEDLSRLLAIPARDTESIARFLHETLEPAIKKAIDELFGEIGKLMRIA